MSRRRESRLISTNRTGWPLIFAMISYDKKMKNQIGYRDSLHDGYDEGWLSDLPLGIRSWPKGARKFYSNFFVVFLDMKLACSLWPWNGGGVLNTPHGFQRSPWRSSHSLFNFPSGPTMLGIIWHSFYNTGSNRNRCYSNHIFVHWCFPHWHRSGGNPWDLDIHLEAPEWS